MAKEFQVEVEGLRELIRALNRVNRELPKELTSLHKELAQPLAQAAAARAPKRSGQLSQSVRPLGSQRVARVAAGKARVRYAGPIHWGWPLRNIRAQPFLVEALQARKEQTIDHYNQLLGAFLDKALER